MNTTDKTYAIEIRHEITAGEWAEFTRDGYSSSTAAWRAVDYYLRKYDKLDLGAAGKVAN